MSDTYEKLIDESNPSNTPGEVDRNPRDEIDSNNLIQNNTETKYDEDVAILTEIGFNSSLISKVYIFLRPTSINQAIQFMTQENGKYQHNFYRYASSTSSSSNRCFICGEEPKNHHDHTENRSSSLLERIINRKSNTDTAKQSELNRVQKTDKEVSKLTCMQHGCKELLSDDFIMHHIKDFPLLINKFQRFKKKLDVLENPNLKFCPQPNCDGVAERKEENEKYVTCNNGHKFCFICLKEWHGKKQCSTQIDKDFLLWKKDKTANFGPKKTVSAKLFLFIRI